MQVWFLPAGGAEEMTAASVSCGVVGVGPSGREAPRSCTADLHPFLACGSSDRRREVSPAGVRVLADPAPKNNKALRWFVLVDGVGGPGWRLVGAETRRLPVRWGIPPESRPEGRKGGGATPHCPAHRRCCRRPGEEEGLLCNSSFFLDCSVRTVG